MKTSRGQLLIFGLVLSFSMAAQAQRYECYSSVTPGQIYQTNTPCPPGTEVQTRRRAPATVSIGRPSSPKFLDNAAFPDDVSADRVERLIKRGMTSARVRAILGEPNAINGSNDGDGLREQWVYTGSEFLRDQYVYFMNGRVTAFQTSR